MLGSVLIVAFWRWWIPIVFDDGEGRSCEGIFELWFGVMLPWQFIDYLCSSWWRWSWDRGMLCRNRMSDRCVWCRCLLRLLSFASFMYLDVVVLCTQGGTVLLVVTMVVRPSCLFVIFKEKSHGRILLARLADRFRSPWKQTSEETMEWVFRSSDFPIFSLDLLCRSICTIRVLSYSTNLIYVSY